MMGEGSGDDEGEDKDEVTSGKSKMSSEDSGCSWGMGELFVAVFGSAEVRKKHFSAYLSLLVSP